MKRVIAIDGPCGAGKSTVARELARELDFDYLDTGALYRAVAIKLFSKGLDENTSDTVISIVLKDTAVRYEDGVVFIDGRDVSQEIRSSQASRYSSVFSARRPVREFLLEVQRGTALHRDLVAEGRDMATVVFPQAWKKFFLTADMESRAARRYEQLKGTANEMTQEEALCDVADRDARDRERALSPLRQASDACVVDTSGFTLEETVAYILRLVQEKSVEEPVAQ